MANAFIVTTVAAVTLIAALVGAGLTWYMTRRTRTTRVAQNPLPAWMQSPWGSLFIGLQMVTVAALTLLIPLSVRSVQDPRAWLLVMIGTGGMVGFITGTVLTTPLAFWLVRPVPIAIVEQG